MLNGLIIYNSFIKRNILMEIIFKKNILISIAAINFAHAYQIIKKANYNS